MHTMCIYIIEVVLNQSVILSGSYSLISASCCGLVLSIALVRNTA